MLIINSSRQCDAYMHHRTGSWLVQVMACRLISTKPLSDQCQLIVNWSLWNELQWNFNWNWNIFIQGNAFGNVVCKMAAILSQPQCVKSKHPTRGNKQRFLTPGHQGWNDLHSLCRIGMEYYLLNNDDNNIIYWIMMIIIMMMMIIIMMTMIIGTTTIMIMIIIITTTLTMTKMIMIKTAQTPCQSLYQDRRI